jgi:hypothetical protein
MTGEKKGSACEEECHTVRVNPIPIIKDVLGEILCCKKIMIMPRLLRISRGITDTIVLSFPMTYRRG